MEAFDYQPRTRLVFGVGVTDRIGELARTLGARRLLLVADRGVVAAGHVDRVRRCLTGAGIAVETFHDFEPNPDSRMIEVGRQHAAPLAMEAIVGLGGGSSLDCAKGINFLLTNGGTMRDYQGFGKATRPLLPMIGLPTTAGTGSEAQTYAVIADAQTHMKMACGDPGSAFRVALLDPDLTTTQPRQVTAATGFDALSHAVESFVTRRRTALSTCFAREAWRLLHGHYERVLDHPNDGEARAAMLLGSHYAGAAIEQSMLGAAHACANPLTAHHQVVHGHALAVLLPHVVRWNASHAEPLYAELLSTVGLDTPPGTAANRLAAELERLAAVGSLPGTMTAAGAIEPNLAMLAAGAAKQWTGTFNPRPFDTGGALEIYRCAQ